MRAEVDHLLDAGEPDRAVALGAGPAPAPATAAVGDLALGLAAASRGDHALAWSCLAGLRPEVWARHAARAWVGSGLDQEPAATLQQVAELTAGAPEWVPSRTWLDLLGPVVGHGDHGFVRALHQRLDQQAGTGDGSPTSSCSAPGCAGGWRQSRAVTSRRRCPGVRRRSRSWTTTTRAAAARRPTSATTCRAWPPSAPWSGTRTSSSKARRTSSTWSADCEAVGYLRRYPPIAAAR